MNALEATILQSIEIPSDNDPEKPEFPHGAPKFPATPTRAIEVPGFQEVLLKDESYNPTGTHKDRMAWEIIVAYRSIILAKTKGLYAGELPAMSIISSGSAATAIQSLFNRFNLPPLRVLIDFRLSPKIQHSLESIGCKLYRTDLAARELDTTDILRQTENLQGFDITCGTAFDSSTRFYDWLSYEIINSSPDYCLMPFGTGTLYENVLNVVKREITTIERDKRFSGDINRVRACNYLGATTRYAGTQADKLYAPHLPFASFEDQWIRYYKTAGFCGTLSDVIPVEEQYFSEALWIAKRQGIECEASGIAGLALLLQNRELIPHDARILIVNTGKTRL